MAEPQNLNQRTAPFRGTSTYCSEGFSCRTTLWAQVHALACGSSASMFSFIFHFVWLRKKVVQALGMFIVTGYSQPPGFSKAESLTGSVVKSGTKHVGSLTSKNATLRGGSLLGGSGDIRSRLASGIAGVTIWRECTYNSERSYSNPSYPHYRPTF